MTNQIERAREVLRQILSAYRWARVDQDGDFDGALEVLMRNVALTNEAAPAGEVEGSCFLCAGKCRGHSLGDPKAWEPEPGSEAAALAPQATIPAGMKPWHGGDSAPEDWDPERAVMFRAGHFGDWSRTWEWRHGVGETGGGRADIIAYTPKAAPQTTPDVGALVTLLTEGIKPMATAERFNWGKRVRDALAALNPVTNEGEGA
jgi:hypothetical protein